MRIIIALINLFRRPKPGRFPMPPPGAIFGAVAQLPIFEYDHEIFDPAHEDYSIYDYLNLKARDGWKLHTITRHAFNDHHQYCLTWERIKRRANHEAMGIVVD